MGNQLGGARRRVGEKVQGLRSIDSRYKIDMVIGNGEAKELICTTHGHELRGGIAGGQGGTGQREQRGKNWDNCNSIIDKIY